MSDERQTIDLREQVIRIDRMLAESDKFVAEQRMLMAESQKFDKERWWFPWLQVVTAIAAIVAAIGVIVHRC
jgi:hypothetical protein